MAEKMKVAEQAKYRAELYGAASEAFQSKGYTTETISDGMLVHLGEGQYSKVKISICDPANLDHEREVYAQKMADAAERAEKARLKAEEKERKAKEKAAKAAEKTPEA